MTAILGSLVGFRTIIFNVIMVILYAAQRAGYISQMPDSNMIYSLIDAVLQNIPPIMAAGNIVLRTLTTTPVGTGKTKP